MAPKKAAPKKAAAKKASAPTPKPVNRTDAAGRSGMGETVTSNVRGKANRESSAVRTAKAAAQAAYDRAFQSSLSRAETDRGVSDRMKQRAANDATSRRRIAANKKK
jgi:hypothetical protein